MKKSPNSPIKKAPPNKASAGGGTSGLHELQRRSLARLVFVFSGLLLIPYAVFEFFASHWFLATLELVGGITLIIGGYRLSRSLLLQRWIYAYLIAMFCFLVYIVLMPGRGNTGFVWVFMMPVLSYLLLGRIAGFLLAAPFMIASGLAYTLRHDEITTAVDLMNFLNPMICGVALLGFIHVPDYA